MRCDTGEHLDSRLNQVLDQCGEQGRMARFWWRDDDVVRDCPELAWLFERTAGVPVALAVIPARAEDSLVEVVAAHEQVRVFQHGWAHVNHTPRGLGLGAWEMDGLRPTDKVLDEMRAGQARLAGLFGERFSPVLVPPWNRVHEPLLPALAALGLRGLSAMGAAAGFEAAPGLRRIDCRFDVLRWENGARFVGWQHAADALVAALDDPDGDKVVGINTHHAVTDAGGWHFIERLSRLIEGHAAAEWADPRQLFMLK